MLQQTIIQKTFLPNYFKIWLVVLEEKLICHLLVYVKLVTPRVGPFLIPGIQFEQSW